MTFLGLAFDPGGRPKHNAAFHRRSRINNTIWGERARIMAVQSVRQGSASHLQMSQSYTSSVSHVQKYRWNEILPVCIKDCWHLKDISQATLK